MCFRKYRHNCLLLSLAVITVMVGHFDCFAQSAERKTNLKPNFIVFLTDDQGYNDVGCFGSPNIRTPNFDRMTEEGMRFTSAYVGSPVCGPSRSALMTGSYPIRIAEPGNKKNLHTVPHTKELMIPEVLKQAGYTSAIIGKWHAGEARTKGDPRSQGFDYFFGTPKFNGFTKYIEQTKMRAPILRNEEVVVKGMEQKEMDQLTTAYNKKNFPDAKSFGIELLTPAEFLRNIGELS